MPSERPSSRRPKHNTRNFPMNFFGLIGTLLASLLKLLGQVLNAIGIVLLALVELLVRLLQQAGKLVLSVVRTLLELISAVLVGMTKPFGGLVGSAKGSKGSSAANALGWLGGTVMVFFLASLISVVLPAQFSNPGWYAGVLRGFVGNGGLLLFGMFCLCLAQAWPAGISRQRSGGRGRGTWLGRAAAALYLLVLPGFTYISFLTWKQVDTNASSQLVTIKQRRDEGLRQIAAASNPAALRQLIQASGTPQPAAAASLDQIKQKASDVVLKASILADEQTGKQRRQAQLGTLIEWIRMLISAFSLAIGSLALAKWASIADDAPATPPAA